jgi:hypothetical protein
MIEPSVSMSTGSLVSSHCGQNGSLGWIEDGEGGTQAQLPAGFHVEGRPGLGRVVVCDQCDEIMPPP